MGSIKDLDARIATISTMIAENMKKFQEDISLQLNLIRSDVSAALIEIKDLKVTVNKQEKEIITLKKAVNKRNIIIKGIAESESVEELAGDFIKVINDKLNITLKLQDIDTAFRIGQSRTDDKSRPIKVILASERAKHLIFKNRSMLKDTDLSINNDIPFELRHKQFLQREARRARQHTDTNFSNQGKRQLSVSPESQTLGPNLRNSSQAKKPNLEQKNLNKWLSQTVT